MRLTAFGTTITATILCGFACSAAIINNRNSCPDIYDCQGKYYSKYVTESLHIGCKDMKISRKNGRIGQNKVTNWYIGELSVVSLDPYNSLKGRILGRKEKESLLIRCLFPVG